MGVMVLSQVIRCPDWSHSNSRGSSFCGYNRPPSQPESLSTQREVFQTKPEALRFLIWKHLRSITFGPLKLNLWGLSSNILAIAAFRRGVAEGHRTDGRDSSPELQASGPRPTWTFQSGSCLRSERELHWKLLKAWSLLQTLALFRTRSASRRCESSGRRKKILVKEILQCCVSCSKHVVGFLPFESA